MDTGEIDIITTNLSAFILNPLKTLDLQAKPVVHPSQQFWISQSKRGLLSKPHPWNKFSSFNGCVYNFAGVLISPKRAKGKLSWYCSKRPVFVSGYRFCKCIELYCRCIEDEDLFICIEMNWWYIENVLRCIQIYCRCIDSAARIWYSTEGALTSMVD